MCGIYCKISKKNIQYSQDAFLEKLSLISHRGPDNTSILTKNNMVFGHTRLSILDIDQRANQPFGDDKYILIYNGEIYNFKDLQKKYFHDIKLKTHSDTEILYEFLKKFGVSKLNELNGMFAFVFANLEKNKLIVARDLSGIKPLYYINNEEYIEICSEIKALDYQISQEKLQDQILYGTYQDGNTPYNNLQPLEGGEYLHIDLSSFTIKKKQFNSFLEHINNQTFIKNNLQEESDLIYTLDKLINSSVKNHLQGDAPMGSLCSGGVDSSLLSVISHNNNPNIKLYHSGIEGGGGEEQYAEMVSKHINKPITYIEMNKEMYWQDFPYLTFISDMPIYHPNDVSLHAIAKVAHEDGIKVMLSGEGADELFGGYSWQQRLMKQYRINTIFEKKTNLLKNLSGNYHKTLKNGFDRFDMQDITNYMPLGLGYMDISIDLFAKSYIFQSQNFRNWKRFQAIKDAYEQLDTNHLERYMQSIIHFNAYGHLGSILHRTDRILMANSIEGRVPFLENDIIQFSMNLPLKYKINKRFKKEGKYLLKKVAAKYLPKEVVYRQKAGFPVRFDKYIEDVEKIFEKGFCMEYTDLSLNDLKAFWRNNPYLKFRMLALEVYGRIFIWKQDYKNIIVE